MLKIFKKIGDFYTNKIKIFKKGFLALSYAEQRVFYISATLLIISSIIFIYKLNDKFLVAIPQSGGSFTEGIIGTPTLINPVLATSESDKDLTALVYSGLLRKGENGELITDLAESYDISNDGTIYTFKLKNNLIFHDKSPLTSKDIAFTIQKIQNPIIKSPRKLQWEGVLVETPDEKTIVFKLRQPYASFLENTTIGILPMHLWQDVDESEFAISNLNSDAIGSGAFMINDIQKDNNISTEFTLKQFKKFALGKPFIKKIVIKIYPNEKELISALKKGTIDQAGGISPFYAEEINKSGIKIVSTRLPRVFGIFFNTSKNQVLSDTNTRSAIDMAINKKLIIDKVLKSYGIAIDSPITENLIAKNENNTNFNIEKAKELLEKSGWKIGTDGIRTKSNTVTKTTGTGKNKKTTTVASGPVTRLEFTLTTSDTPELVEIADLIKLQMLDIGIQMDVRVYEKGSLSQIIRARDYEALLFGQVINQESDLFAFWHSSQRVDPGLNIALYSNINIDKILEGVQKTLIKKDREIKYREVENIFKKDMPAVFIYSPLYVYATNQYIETGNLSGITNSSERWSNVYKWYRNDNKVWKIFTN